MNVEILKADDSACEAFVQQTPNGKICHLPAWSRAVMRATGHRPFYLVARDNGEVRGVLPLVHVKSRLFGNQLVSQAFCNYGGILAEGVAARDVLFNRAVALAVELGCEFIELRNINP